MSSSFVPPSPVPPPRRDILAPPEPYERARREAAQRVSPPRGVNASLPLVQQDMHATRTPTPPRSIPRTPPRAVTPRSVPQIGASKTQLGAWRFLSITGVVACIATGTQLYRVMADRDILRQALAARSMMTSRQGTSAQTDITIRDRFISALTGPSMRVIDLRNYGATNPVGRMFWDGATGNWAMYTYTLSAAKPGTTYQLWIVANDGRPPFSAGTFVPDAEGKAEVHTNYPLALKAFERVVISEEPDGGSMQPSRHVILAGR